MILTQKMCDNFLGEIKSTFPNFIAGILTDEHGFPIASNIPKSVGIREDRLALSAISEMDFVDMSEYQKIVKDVGKKEKIKLLILLEKSARYLYKFKNFNDILNSQSLF